MSISPELKRSLILAAQRVRDYGVTPTCIYVGRDDARYVLKSRDHSWRSRRGRWRTTWGRVR